MLMAEAVHAAWRRNDAQPFMTLRLEGAVSVPASVFPPETPNKEIT